MRKIILSILFLLAMTVNVYAAALTVTPTADFTDSNSSPIVSYAITQEGLYVSDAADVNTNLTSEGYSYSILADYSTLTQSQKNLIKTNLGSYSHLLDQTHLINVNKETFCMDDSNFPTQYWICNGVKVSKAVKYHFLLQGILPPTNNPVAAFPYCKTICYDARTDLPAPIDLVPSDGTKTFTINIKKGLSGWGAIRPYDNECFLTGKFSLCVSGSTLTLKFIYPDGTTYSVTGQLQQKYWNTFSWSVNPNLIALFVRQHGTNVTTFKYVNLVYKPIDNDKIGFSYSFNETYTPLAGDNYDYSSIHFQPGSLTLEQVPFCGEQINQCGYDYDVSHAWTEYGKVFFGLENGTNIEQIKNGVSTYFRNNTQEAAFNTGDLLMSDSTHQGRGGAYRMWYIKKTTNPVYTFFSQPETWAGAEAYCKNLGGTLASIHSASDNDAVKSLMQGRYSIWLGGTAISESPIIFSWADGTQFSYTNWRSGEPNNYHGATENKLMMYADGTWNDVTATGGGIGSMPFVCENVSTDKSILSHLKDLGITQQDTKNGITEEFGMNIPLPSLTPKKIGFTRKASDFPSNMKLGYGSNRTASWQPFVVGSLNRFFVDTGIAPAQCPPGQQPTTDGCFKDSSSLCPAGQVELYPTYGDQCFNIVRSASCLNGQTQFGNSCYLNKGTPNVCPSDGRN